MNKMLLTAGAVAVGFALGAGETVLNLECKNYVANCKWDGSAMKIRQNWGSATCKQLLPVSTAKKYVLSGEARTVNPGDKGRFYLGFKTFDAKQREISIESVYAPNAKTLGEVAVAVKPGDKVVQLKNAGTWKLDRTYNVLAFGAKKDFSDLPNYNLSPYATGTATDAATGVTTLTLKAPMKQAVAAGTVVRLQRSGATYMYSAAANAELTNEWKAFKGMVGGVAKSGTSRNDQWRPGTAYASVIVLNHGKTPIELRNIKVVEL